MITMMINEINYIIVIIRSGFKIIIIVERVDDLFPITQDRCRNCFYSVIYVDKDCHQLSHRKERNKTMKVLQQRSWLLSERSLCFVHFTFL